jgi:hypothetical protein
MRKSRFMLVPLAVVVGLLVSSPGSAVAQDADTEEVVLPSRVANAINRAELSLDAASVSIDTGDKAKAVTSLNGVRLNLYRADKAARAQMNAAPPAEDDAAEPAEGAPEAPDAPETLPGPDSVIAVLGLDQTVVTTVAGLFDNKQGAVLTPLSSSLFAAMNTRDKLLASVIALDPEGAGADYADGMADTVAGYDDEVANLTEALAVDQLSAGGRKVLTAALNQAKATQAKVADAFGGGE